jgi:leucyl-tRNA synthetase
VKAARRDIHLALKQANYDYERIQYNTVVSAGMKMLNALEAVPPDAAGRAGLLREGLSILIRTLYPVVPHNGCALWDELGSAEEFGPLLDAPWPQVDPAALAQDEIELVLQVNGKLRGKLTVPADADGKSIEAAARASAEVAKHAAGAPVKKVIVVPGRLVNVVV